MATRRSTRNWSQKSLQLNDFAPISKKLPGSSDYAPPCQSGISLFSSSSSLSTKSTGLSKRDLVLLLKKQRLLKISTPEALISLDPHLNHTLLATLVFAQSEAGTAFCISSTGLLITCSHCVSEDPSELEENRIKWLLFASGRAVQAKCIAYDHIRDLALLQITSAEQEPISTSSNTSTNHQNPSSSFPFLPISSTPPKKSAQMICIGHPGDEDLETSKPGVKTDYDVIHISYGRYRGIAEGADVQDNSEIGALMHDCWTYWGHSGAPLCMRKDGSVVGMHSSWDDETGMRRGVAWEAILEFLRENGDPHVIQDLDEGVVGSRETPILVE
ncbi:hypothetical protein TWF225_009295 [Orbilia oligospora]|nr:hypothetical protein TWF225_009295 [Orbilia oligospora]KAF3269936.1 hypothetical protein TWF217_008279 [Orbilia oligospora]KAF3270396.1 hypothetical protein TWF128_004170 [Orbilia oligospora]